MKSGRLVFYYISYLFGTEVGKRAVGLLKYTAMFYEFLFPQYLRDRAISLILFLIRLFFGIMFFMHGVDKMQNFNELSDTFPSVLGFGSYMTLMLAIFCEFACSLFLITGLLTRIILLPMILSMAVAFFDVHDAMMPQGELSLIYLVVFFGLFFTGPGRYSLDYLIDKSLKKKEKQEHSDVEESQNSEEGEVL